MTLRWILLLLVLAGLFARSFLDRSLGGPGGTSEMESRLYGRTQLGLPRLAARSGREAAAPSLLDFQRTLGTRARTAAERLRLVPLAGEIFGAAEARARIERLLGEAGTEEVLPILRRIYRDEKGRPTEAEAALLRERLGWSGELAALHGLPDSDPAREAFLADCDRFVLLLGVLTMLAVVAALVSLVLFLIALVRLLRGRLVAREAAPLPGPRDVVWLEVPLVLLAGVLLFSFLPVGRWNLALLALAPFWPLARGVSWAEWREALALRRGAGFVREIGAGVAGYLAALPLVALAAALMVAIVKWTGTELSHPFVEEAKRAGGPGAGMVLLATCVWAPLVEESCFRGALYRHLRPYRGAVASAVLVGLLFALAHPQGLAAVPVLATLGAILALLRHWRGSLIASVTAHAMHNGVLMGLLLLFR